MVLWRSTQSRGSDILTLLISFFALAHADVWTGYAQVLRGPVDECSQPVPMPERTRRYVVSSDFTYTACREYRSSETNIVYYKIETMMDGQFVYLLPAPNQEFIDPKDFTATSEAAVTMCRKLRQIRLDSAVPLQSSHCAGE